MKIMIYSHFFPPSIGGVETYVALLAKGLAEGLNADREDICCVTATPQGVHNDSALPYTVIRKPGIRELFRRIREADVIHLAGPAMLPLMLAILARKTVVVEHHGYQAVCPNGLLLYTPDKTVCPDSFMKHRYLRCLRCNASEADRVRSLKMLLLEWPRRWLCKLATAQLCITRHVATRVRLPRSTVIYYGVPETEWHERPSEVASGNSGETPTTVPFTVGYVGRLVQEKDVGTLIRAAGMAKNAGVPIALKIIGDGPERNYLERMVRAEVGARGCFAGALKEPELAHAANQIDVLVLPSRWEEPAGLVVMEQMMRGRPVIVTDNGGSAEVAGETGLTFPPGDVAALAECIGRFTKEPELLEKLGRRARERASELFTEHDMIVNHYNLFELLLQAKNARRFKNAQHVPRTYPTLDGMMLKRWRNALWPR